MGFLAALFFGFLSAFCTALGSSSVYFQYTLPVGPFLCLIYCFYQLKKNLISNC